MLGANSRAAALGAARINDSAYSCRNHCNHLVYRRLNVRACSTLRRAKAFGILGFTAGLPPTLASFSGALGAADPDEMRGDGDRIPAFPTRAATPPAEGSS